MTRSFASAVTFEAIDTAAFATRIAVVGALRTVAKGVTKGGALFENLTPRRSPAGTDAVSSDALPPNPAVGANGSEMVLATDEAAGDEVFDVEKLLALGNAAMPVGDDVAGVFGATLTPPPPHATADEARLAARNTRTGKRQIDWRR